MNLKHALKTLNRNLMVTLATATAVATLSRSVMAQAPSGQPLQAPSVHQANAPVRVTEFSCTARESRENFPVLIRIQLTSVDQIETTATYRDGRSFPTDSLRRLEIPTQPRHAVFNVAGAMGISGEAKILISKEALRLGEVGMIMLINQSTRDSADYQCRR